MANIEAKRISIAPNMDRPGSDRSICLRMKINRKEASATSAALEITNAKPVHDIGPVVFNEAPNCPMPENSLLS